MPLNLTTALIALAVLVLAGILVQGLWKARRIKAGTARTGLNVVVGDEPGARREPAMGDELPPPADAELPAAAAPQSAQVPQYQGAISALGKQLYERQARFRALFDRCDEVHTPDSSRYFYVEGYDAYAGRVRSKLLPGLW